MKPATKPHNMVGFEDVKHAIQLGPMKFILINTFEQDFIIQGTVSSEREEIVINAQLTDIRSRTCLLLFMAGIRVMIQWT